MSCWNSDRMTKPFHNGHIGKTDDKYFRFCFECCPFNPELLTLNLQSYLCNFKEV